MPGVARLFRGDAAAPHLSRRMTMQKIKLELDDLEITSFTMEKDGDESRGTVIANSTVFGCGYTYTFPSTCNPDICPVAADV
jgi:hypothetical protein